MADLTRIQFKRSKTANKVPAFADIAEGELAINLTDKRIFSNDGTSIIELGFSKGGTVDGDIIAKNITAVNTIEVKNIQGAAKSLKLTNTKTLTENVYVRAFENATYNGIELGAENLPSTTLQLQLPKSGAAGTLVINGAVNLVNNTISNVGVLDTSTTIDGAAVVIRGNTGIARTIEGRLDNTTSWTIGKASKTDNIFSLRYYGSIPGALNTQLLMDGITTRITGTPLNVDSSIAAGFVGSSSLGSGSIALISANSGIVGTADGIGITVDQKSFLKTSLASLSINASYPIVVNYPSVNKAQVSLFSGPGLVSDLGINIGTDVAPSYSHYLRGTGRVDIESSLGLYVKNNSITAADIQITPKITSMITNATPTRSIWMRGRSDLNATIWQTSVLGNTYKIGGGVAEDAPGLTVDSSGMVNTNRLQLNGTVGNTITIPTMTNGNAVNGLATPAALYLPATESQQTIGVKWTIPGERNVCALGVYPRPVVGNTDLFQISMANACFRFDSTGSLIALGGADYSNNNLWRLMPDGRASFIDVEIRSDIRHKSNINSIENALEKVQSLDGLEYDLLLGDGSLSRSAGVSAQDVEKILPQLVSEDEAGRKNLKYNGLIGLLVNAVKELKAEVDELKSR
ncbi:hypothetical protein fHeYen901_269 [Yersinia phage fHe-Yen9-01]|uniref:Long tail fiber protein Gp37 n=1 Tax=Yersinia phage fHe-Yen9-01 TaxID=1965363 RepID=A0A1V0DY07_9CAUD|nr:long tail fiber protein distal subunit [Yersinia phage fHe-Yen9-01]ARB06042.1 hypothetical protein fHeYen901_269 [Yersinia phage fHe-Yen9-01]